MCQALGARSSSTLQTDSEAQEIIASLNFIFVSHGIVLCVIVIFGLALNFMCIGVLCRKCFRTAPYCLLLALTLGDILTLTLSLYSDVQPAIDAHKRLNGLVEKECEILNKLNDLLEARNRNGTGNASGNSSMVLSEEDVKAILEALLSEENPKRTVARSIPTQQTNPPYGSDENSTAVVGKEEEKSIDTDSVPPVITTTKPKRQVQVNSQPITKAVERFVAYFLMTYTLLIAAVLALERCFVILKPFRAKDSVTVKRTCRVVLGIVVVCCIIHSPQMVKEVVLAIKHPEALEDDFQGTMLQSFRQHYERFVAYMTSSLLAFILIVNCCLVAVVVRYNKKAKNMTGQSRTEKRNVNVAYVIIVIIFCLLPQSIAANVIVHLALAQFLNNLSVVTRVFAVIRVLYVANSACNCLVYCILGQKFRRVFCQTYFRCCSCSGQSRGSLTGSGDRSTPCPSPDTLRGSRVISLISRSSLDVNYVQSSTL
ncbi:hypothetical protein BaRGS_00039529 [Batillaria attramentaria]|uniref:G-protein coupled receptors family 1 profile domain-containing protein n=1 Tax=Batillaria attramentaria TaxID=370345 RepID=A0ABD0J2P6_9CAEN